MFGSNDKLNEKLDDIERETSITNKYLLELIEVIKDKKRNEENKAEEFDNPVKPTDKVTQRLINRTHDKFMYSWQCNSSWMRGRIPKPVSIKIGNLDTGTIKGRIDFLVLELKRDKKDDIYIAQSLADYSVFAAGTDVVSLGQNIADKLADYYIEYNGWFDDIDHYKDYYKDKMSDLEDGWAYWNRSRITRYQ